MSKIVPLMGIETEYGIIREDQDSSDPVEESMQLLRRCELKSVQDSWAYDKERTHTDMRGFQVSRLAQDEEEDEFCEQDKIRPYTYREMKCDRVLTNGARFYNDHTHPEYSTPECQSVFELVTHDLAGERIIAECVRLRNRDLGGNYLQVFKNNTDYSGHSYGTHDNYLISRRQPFDYWVQFLVPFLITRQLYAGAGKVGSEIPGESLSHGFQLSQRADFVETILSIETMTKRPIINTRDEPHSTQEKYRRLHLILGDANMSPYATALKLGTTRLVLTMIGAEVLPPPVELEDPVWDVKQVSRDITGTVPLKKVTGTTITPLEIQESYLDHALKHKNLFENTEEWKWLTDEWARTLNDIREDPNRLTDRIDWAIKRNLFNEFMESEGVDWEDPIMQSLDLEYHNLDPERGLFNGLMQQNEILSIIPESEIRKAIHEPPNNTRAKIRGNFVESERENVKSIHWTKIEFLNGEYLDLTDVIDKEDVDQTLDSYKEQYAWK